MNTTSAAAQAGTASLHIQHLLVPIDFSGASQRTLDYAMSLAAPFRARVSLLHVVEPVVYPAELGYAPVAIESLHTTTKTTAMEKLTEMMQTQVPELLRGQTSVRTGVPFHEITSSAVELGVD